MSDDAPQTPGRPEGGAPEGGAPEGAPPEGGVSAETLRPDETTPEPFTPSETVDRFPPEGPSPERTAIGAFLVLLAVAVVAVAIWQRDQPVTVSHHLLLSLILFTTGGLGVLMRKSAIVILMCVELMLNAVNLAFIAFARMWTNVDAHAIVLFVMIVAAAEVAVGLAIVVAIFMRKLSANVDELSELRG